MMDTSSTSRSLFLEKLCADTLVTFQTYDDSESGRKDLNRIMHGDSADTFRKLQNLNDRGAGIFIMVNEGNGRGRRAENVVRVRSVFVDLDGAPLENVTSASLKPHITIESSPGRYHVYWLVDDCPLEKFTPIQKSLAKRFDGDPKVHDLPRVMRLPGFCHRKKDPFKTHVIEINDAPHYSIEQVIQELGLALQTETRSAGVLKEPFRSVTEGGRANAITRAAGTHIRNGADLHETLDYCYQLNAGYKPPLPIDVIETTVRNIWERDQRRGIFRTNHSISTENTADNEPDLLTDQRIKQHFAELYRGLVNYVPGIGWLIWDGKRWSTDTPGGLYPFIHQMVQQLWKQSETIQDEDVRIKRRKGLVGLESHGRQTTIIEACQTVPALIKNANQLDQDPMLLNCLNGTLNLRTGTVRPHSPEDLITRVLNIEYSPMSECPAFQKFISWAMRGDDDLISYIRRFAGYCLTGRTDEQILNFWYGVGGNGKTTLMNVFQWLLGDYASTADTGLIMQRRNGSDSNRLSMLAGLRGSRVVTLSEVNDGERLDEAAIKSFTGGDIITCRHLYEGFFSYIPQSKLIGFGNYKPHVKGTDNGIWRRIHLVPFLAVISDDEKDPSLPEKLRAELPGILTWAVKGCLEWQRMGLSAPGAILEATQEYRQAEDVFSNWLNECCAVSHGTSDTSGSLFDSFKRFSGWNSITATRFGKMLSEHGFARRKSHGKVIWDGLRIESGDDGDSYTPFSQKSIRESGYKSFEKTPQTVTTVPQNTSSTTEEVPFFDFEGLTASPQHAACANAMLGVMGDGVAAHPEDEKQEFSFQADELENFDIDVEVIGHAG